ncbi:LacI family DNA-binding transcriptional regulator [Priestia megaterium]
MSTNQVNSMEVAKLAGVSQSTVSRVFDPNAKGKVAIKTRKKILEAANALGYYPNALAKGLVTKKTNLIGLLIGADNPYFYSQIQINLIKKLQEKGYQIISGFTESSEVKPENIFKFIQYDVDGLIVAGVTLSPNVLSILSKYKVPFVLYNQYTEDLPCHFVCCDNYFAGEETGKHLLDKGHQYIAYISGNNNTQNNIDYQRGFYNALYSKGIKSIFKEGDYTFESGYIAALELLTASSPIDAIVCVNILMALGVIEAIKSLGLSVLDDVSVIGIDDSPTVSWPPYLLTIWRQPIEQMNEITIDTLLNEVNRKSDVPKGIWLRGTIIEKGSFKNANKNCI